jgi:peptidoglycan/LPS O-acetylase OafA/YrhL
LILRSLFAIDLTKEGHVDSLTGLRAIAAGVVVLHHLVPSEKNTLVHSILGEFNVGVTIFFVLSGFLITYRYFDQFERGKNWFYNYFINRVARVYPMYFFLTAFTFFQFFLAQKKLDSNLIVQFLLNITFLRGFFSDYVYSGISQGWTLTVEECFYFSAPLIFFLSRRIPVILQALIIFVLGYLTYLVFRNIQFHGFMNQLSYIFITTYFGRVFEFAIGMLLAMKVIKHSVKISNATWVGGIGFLLAFACQVVLNFSTGVFAIQTVTGFAINSLVISASVAVLMLGLLSEETVIKRLLGNNLLVILGKSSYTLYLLHFGMVGYLIRRFISSHFIVELIMTYILSILLWYFIEEPCNKLVKKLKKNPSANTNAI